MRRWSMMKGMETLLFACPGEAALDGGLELGSDFVLTRGDRLTFSRGPAQRSSAPNLRSQWIPVFNFLRTSSSRE